MATKRRTIFRVIKRNGKWVVKVNHCVFGGWTMDDSAKTKAQAIDLAFAYAKKIKGAIVRLFSAKDKLQVEISHRGVLNYVPGE